MLLLAIFSLLAEYLMVFGPTERKQVFSRWPSVELKTSTHADHRFHEEIISTPPAFRLHTRRSTHIHLHCEPEICYQVWR